MENDALRDMLKGHARAAGLPADAAGKFLSEVAASIRADEEEAFKEADEALKDEWGAEYDDECFCRQGVCPEAFRGVRRSYGEDGCVCESGRVPRSARHFPADRRGRLEGRRPDSGEDGSCRRGSSYFAPTPITVIIRRSPILRIHSGGRLPIIIISWWGFPVSFLR